MVEMLGTLAIIGVLSVGGVSGYGRAITAYRANAVVDNAQKQAMNTATEAVTQNSMTNPRKITEMKISTSVRKHLPRKNLPNLKADSV